MPGELQEKWREAQWYEFKVERAFTDESNAGSSGIILVLMCTSGEMSGKTVDDKHWVSINNAETQREIFNSVFDFDIATITDDNVVMLEGRKCGGKMKEDGKFGWKVARLRKAGVVTLPGDTPARRIARFFGTPSPEPENAEPFKKQF